MAFQTDRKWGEKMHFLLKLNAPPLEYETCSRSRCLAVWNPQKFPLCSTSKMDYSDPTDTATTHSVPHSPTQNSPEGVRWDSNQSPDHQVMKTFLLNGEANWHRGRERTVFNLFDWHSALLHSVRRCWEITAIVPVHDGTFVQVLTSPNNSHCGLESE